MNGHDDCEIVVVNEFAAVRVRKVRTRNGERLEIASLHHDHAVRLDALALESLTWRSVLEIGEGLRTPFGPEPGEAPNGQVSERARERPR